jgi:hypothetical protein
MAKALNTGHALYNNVVRALVGDDYKQYMYAIDGKADLPFQTGNNCRVTSTGLTFTAQQGIAFDGTHWFGSSGGASPSIVKYNTSSVSQASNTTPFDNLPAGTDHIGDICVDDTYVYAVCDNYSGGTATVASIVRYNKTDLTYHSHWDIQETNYNASGICISADGTELLVSAFEPTTTTTTVRATEIRRYGITDGVKIGAHTLSAGIRGIQGLTYGDNHYFFSSFGSENEVYLYDDTFTFVAKYDPVLNNTEMEGVEFYNGNLYFHVINGSPQILDYRSNLYISKDTAASDPVKFIDAADVPESGSIVMRINPFSLFNFNSLIDNLTGSNDWESWIYSDGRLAWRIDSSKSIIHSSVSAQTEYLVTLAWEKSGTSVTTKLGVDGAFVGSNTGTWKAVRDLWLGGANGSNTQGDNTYHEVLVYNKMLSDAELADLNTNYDSVYATGGGTNYPITLSSGSVSVVGQAATIDLTPEITVTGQTGTYAYDATASQIDLTGEISVLGGTATFNYNAIDSSVVLTGEIQVDAQTALFDFNSVNATVQLSGELIVSGATAQYNYSTVNGTINLFDTWQVKPSVSTSWNKETNVTTTWGSKATPNNNWTVN